jgi:hypothetical protein
MMRLRRSSVAGPAGSPCNPDLVTQSGQESTAFFEIPSPPDVPRAPIRAISDGRRRTRFIAELGTDLLVDREIFQ